MMFCAVFENCIRMELVFKNLTNFCEKSTVSSGVHKNADSPSTNKSSRRSVFATTSGRPAAAACMTTSSLAGKTAVPLGLNGVEPNKENILSGSYPLVGDLALIYKDANLNSLARKFIDYIFSEEGSKILEAKGLVTVKR